MICCCNGNGNGAACCTHRDSAARPSTPIAAPKDARTEQTLLRQAQQAIETAKQSELRNYFRDPCIDAMTQPVERLSAQTAVLYPIILPDRLELFAGLGGVC